MIEREMGQIKEGKYWSVRLHGNQGYLGRCVVWCKREDVEDLTQCTADERDELFNILTVLREAANALFHPDRINYAFLGNIEPHLHGHFIPRYKAPQEYEGVTFKDARWGRNYDTDPEFVTPDDVALKIAEAYRLKLEK